MHLTYHWFIRMKEAHEATHVARHHLIVDHGVPDFAGIVITSCDLGIERRAWRNPRATEVSALLILYPFCTRYQIVSAAEPLTVSGKGNDVHLWVQVGVLDTLRKFTRHIERNAVSPLRAIESDPR